jgi:hypothetical protein
MHYRCIMSIGPPAGTTSSICPYQQGKARGRRFGLHVARDVEWLIDTGADISAVWNSIGAAFDVKSIGATASGTTGGGGIQIVTGIVAEFQAEDSSGRAHTVSGGRHMGIKSGDTGSNIFGMDSMAAAGATVSWDPNGGAGLLTM